MNHECDPGRHRIALCLLLGLEKIASGCCDWCRSGCTAAALFWSAFGSFLETEITMATDDPLRKALGLVGAAHPDKWLRPAECHSWRARYGRGLLVSGVAAGDGGAFVPGGASMHREREPALRQAIRVVRPWPSICIHRTALPKNERSQEFSAALELIKYLSDFTPQYPKIRRSIVREPSILDVASDSVNRV